MSRTARNFRVRVSTRGASGVSGSVDLTFTDADIAGLPDSWGGQDVSPLEGRVKARGWTVTIHDRSDQVTANLSGDLSTFAFKAADILDRWVDLSTSEDGGSTWTVEATGRLDGINNPGDNPAVYKISVITELARLRDRTLFEETKKIGSGNSPEATTSLYPGGVWGGWGMADGVAPIKWFVDESAQDRVTLEKAGVDIYLEDGSVVIEHPAIDGPGRTANIPKPNREAIKDDLKADVTDLRADSVPDTAADGHFEHLRLWVESINGSTSAASAQQHYELFAQKGLMAKDGSVGKKTSVEWAGEKSRTVKKISVKWTNDQPDSASLTAEGDTVEAIIYKPNISPSERVPLHFGGEIRDPDNKGFKAGGLHPIDWAKKIFDLTDTSYNSTQLETKKNQRSDLPKLFPRLKGSVNGWDELREKVFKAHGLFPVLNKSGEIEIREAVPPTEGEIPDVTTLDDFEAQHVAGPKAPSFRIEPAEQVTKVVLKPAPHTDYMALPRDQMKWSREPDGADMIQADERDEKTYTRHVDELGEHELVLDFSYLENVWRLGGRGGVQFGKQVAEAILDRFAQGGIWTELLGMESRRDVAVGDYVIVDVDSYPNLRDQTRGGSRLMQVVARSLRIAGADFTLLDLGPDNQPLAAPTLSATATGPFSIDVTVNAQADSSAGRTVLEAAKADAEPAQGSDSWYPAAEGGLDTTYTVDGLEPETTYYFRARHFRPAQIASDWSNVVSATTETLDPPTGLSVVEDLGCAVRISWSNGEPGLSTQILVDGTPRHPLDPPGATERWVGGLDPSTAYTIEVRHIGAHGGTSSSASLSHTTGSASTGPRTGGLFLLVGERV